MRRVVLGLSLAIAAPAAAGEPGGAEPVLVTPPRPVPARPGSIGYSHKGQLEASLRLALGLRAIAPYDDQSYCGVTDTSAKNGNAPVCIGRAPFSLDFELGYGIARAIDLIVELRVGLEQDFAASPSLGDGPRMLHLSPGARFFFSDSGKAKLFTTVQLVLDFAGYQDLANKDRGADFGVRNLNGLWFDLDRAYGFYAYVGDTLTAARWMRFELEAGIGIQGRYR
jgi:hypothetical protein